LTSKLPSIMKSHCECSQVSYSTRPVFNHTDL
jgi:hypothetical protein